MQTNKIIKKVLVELDKEAPRLEYIRGLLEGVVGDDIFEVKTPINLTLPQQIKDVSEILDEAAILDAQAKANISKISKAIEE